MKMGMGGYPVLCIKKLHPLQSTNFGIGFLGAYENVGICTLFATFGPDSFSQEFVRIDDLDRALLYARTVDTVLWVGDSMRIEQFDWYEILVVDLVNDQHMISLAFIFITLHGDHISWVYIRNRNRAAVPVIG